MNKFICVMIAVCAMGCTRAVQPTYYPTQPPPQPQVKQEETPSSYEQCSKYVWNKSAQAYDWVASEEHKEVVGEYWEAAKKAIHDATESKK